jgi:hypothetical protein
MSGFRNVAVFGRAVTNVLQNMRSVDRETFNTWYAPRQEAMRADPLLRYFYELRSEILKEGPPEHSSSLTIDYLDGTELAEIMADPPPGARSFFIGDSLGGSGWEVEMSDGSIETYYVRLPGSVKLETSLHLVDTPTHHRGVPIENDSLETLSRLYVSYLERLVADAEADFTQ